MKRLLYLLPLLTLAACDSGPTPPSPDEPPENLIADFSLAEDTVIAPHGQVMNLKAKAIVIDGVVQVPDIKFRVETTVGRGLKNWSWENTKEVEYGWSTPWLNAGIYSVRVTIQVIYPSGAYEKREGAYILVVSEESEAAYGPPGAPQNLTSSYQNIDEYSGEVHLNWTAPSDPDVLHYEVETRTGHPESTWQMVAISNDTSHVTTVTRGDSTEYTRYYRVWTVDEQLKMSESPSNKTSVTVPKEDNPFD